MPHQVTLSCPTASSTLRKLNCQCCGTFILESNPHGSEVRVSVKDSAGNSVTTDGIFTVQPNFLNGNWNAFVNVNPAGTHDVFASLFRRPTAGGTPVLVCQTSSSGVIFSTNQTAVSCSTAECNSSIDAPKCSE